MNGIVIMNKHKGCTSHDVVYKAKKFFNEKVGHTGTLDPMATGVLPLLIGKATLCSKYLINHDKIYEVKIQFGKKTDTADSEGKIVEEKIVEGNVLEKENIEKVLKDFVGKQEQIPPIYSAIKVNGKKLYEYARKGEKVEIKSRQIEIYSIKLISIDLKEKQISFEVSCSKGTYIRSLCEDIASKLNTVGYMIELNRLQVGEFNIENSITIEDLDKFNKDRSFFQENFIDIEKLFKGTNSMELDNRQLELFLNGVKLTQECEEGIYRIYSDKKFIGIGIIKNNLLKRDIIV